MKKLKIKDIDKLDTDKIDLDSLKKSLKKKQKYINDSNKIIKK